MECLPGKNDASNEEVRLAMAVQGHATAGRVSLRRDRGLAAPTIPGRFKVAGSLLSWEGELNMKKAEYKRRHFEKDGTEEQPVELGREGSLPQREQ